MLQGSFACVLRLAGALIHRLRVKRAERAAAAAPAVAVAAKAAAAAKWAAVHSAELSRICREFARTRRDLA
eukprot:2345459-Prymnesium_polylepis.1